MSKECQSCGYVANSADFVISALCPKCGHLKTTSAYKPDSVPQSHTTIAPRTFAFLVIAIFVLIIGGWYISKDSPLYEEAQALRQQGDFAQAITVYDRIQHRYPSFIEFVQEKPRQLEFFTYLNWGKDLLNKGDFKKAIKKIEDAQSFRLSPELQKKGKQALRDIHRAWGVQHLEREEFREATQQFIAADDKQKLSIAYVAWGEQLVKINKFQEAIKRFKLAHSKPHITQAYLTWGEYFEKEKKYGVAIKKYQRVLQGHYQRGQRTLIRKKIAQLTSVYTKQLLAQHKYAQAIKYYTSLLENTEQDMEADATAGIQQALWKWGHNYWRNKQWTLAVGKFESLLSKYPESWLGHKVKKNMPRWLLSWGNALRKDNQCTEAIPKYKKIIQKYPHSSKRQEAEKRVIDCEVALIVQGDHGTLPSPTRVSGGGGRGYTATNIHNDTEYHLTVRYSGPESFKVLFDPQEKGSIEYLPGHYQVAASVDAAHVRNYAGVEDAGDGNYEAEYYIVTFGMRRVRIPNFFPTEFKPWPNKRRINPHRKP